ncbi:MAG: ABC transporter ATP-binding protein [Gemmatimonadales bacterium]
MLEVAARKRLGEFQLDVDFAAAAGETLVVVGESGSGKTTLLKLLAGIDRPDSGRIIVAGQPYFDGRRQVDVPAWERMVGFVPQDYALFPHLSVRENVAFGLRAQGISGAAAAPRVMRSLEQFGIGDLAAARPSELSGGQQQRVAIARALVLEPALLLLDEPLSALDLGTRQAIRTELRRVLKSLSCVTVYVTHAPSEALVLGDRIVVLEDGRVAQAGAREELLRRPRSTYIAAFLGLNLFRGRVIDQSADGVARISTMAGELRACSVDGAGPDVVVTVAPKAVRLHRERPLTHDTNVFSGTVAEVIPEPPGGDRMRVRLDGELSLVADISASALRGLGLREGGDVWASIDVGDIVAYS